MRVVSLLVVWSTIAPLLVVCQQCGSFSYNNLFFNLSSLTSPTGYNASEAGSDYLYWFNLCKIPPLPNAACAYPGFNAYQLLPGSPPACIPIGSLPGTTSYNVTAKKIVMQYTNTLSAFCRDRIFRTTTVNIACDLALPKPIVLSITEPSDTVCHYVIEMAAAAACPGVPNDTDCCSVHSTPGCAEKAMEQCVCQQNPGCCSSGWTSDCVDSVRRFGCGVCSAGRCCTVHSENGCEDRAVSTCVCSAKPQCCTGGWSADCVTAVDLLKCGSCIPNYDCCAPETCPTKTIRDCVCARDIYCCEAEWDRKCVEEVTQFKCGNCTTSWRPSF